jgi:starvation-inducible DNA-binding protein
LGWLKSQIAIILTTVAKRIVDPATLPEGLMANSQTSAVERPQKDIEPTADLGRVGAQEISSNLICLLADVFALYLKTKNFHWHMSGRHFRDYHLLLDEHADQLFGMTDAIAERARKLGGPTIHSVGEISRNQRLHDNDEESLPPKEMLVELCCDNRELTRFLRAAHELCEEHNDVATASLIEVWIDETERRTWFLREVARDS